MSAVRVVLLMTEPLTAQPAIRPASQHLEEKERGWRWVTSQLQHLLHEARAEADRLLGPDRGH